MAEAGPLDPRRAVPLDRVRAARGESRVAVPRNKVAGTRAFRRIRADRAFGVVGVLLVVFALVLVFRWEKTISPEPSTAIDWVESPVNVTFLASSGGCTPATPGGHGQVCNVTSPGASTATRALTFDIAEANVSSLRVSLWWRDAVGDAHDEWDLVHFNLTGPPTTERELRSGLHWATSTGRYWNETLGVSPIPAIRSLPVASEAEARAALGNRHTDRNGTGTWTLTIDVHVLDDWEPNAEPLRNQQADHRCPQTTPGMCRVDDHEEFEVRLSYTTYRAVFHPSGSS